MNEKRSVDVVVVGGGQTGLALGYYLRRTGLSFVILDGQAKAGGAWQQGWESLHLFSPATASSLPGWPMPASQEQYPSRNEVIAYLAAYEARYQLPIQRLVRVTGVYRAGEGLRVESDEGTWQAGAVISATGTWARPITPDYPGQEQFQGRQLHSAFYHSPESFAGRRVLVVGGGNSGAQIVADLSSVADVTWSTQDVPAFLPDHVDGRYLFEQATARYQAAQAGATPEPAYPLGNIVVVPPVRAAREQGHLHSTGPVDRFTATGVVFADGREQPLDAVIWCTGFRAALEHLRPLGVLDEGERVAMQGTHSLGEPRLWLVGYGDWTGFASATLIGVGRTARTTAQEVATCLQNA